MPPPAGTFKGEPVKVQLKQGQKLARFFDSSAKGMLGDHKAFGHWWVHVYPKFDPNGDKQDIRDYCATARQVLAISEEWPQPNDMTYLVVITLTANWDCYEGKAAAQGKLPGGWTQIYADDPKPPCMAGDGVKCYPPIAPFGTS